VDARESSHESAAPKEQPPPESLRHQGPRAPDSLESAHGKAGAAEGAKLSGAKDRRGRQPGQRDSCADSRTLIRSA